MWRHNRSAALCDTERDTTMSRYNQHSGSGTGSNDNDEEFDDTTVKLQKYAAVRLTPTRVNAADTEYGDRFIVGFDDTTVLDGVVFQRDDRPDTWKVFSPKKFFNVGPDGHVYETYDADDDEYSDEMSAQDVLEHPRVQGFSETFGGNSYWYTPVGVVIEEADDIATNDDLDVETSDDGIDVGETSMLLSNKSWVRTFAKLMTVEGDSLIETTENDQSDVVPVTDSHGWLSTDEATLREALDGRALELFVIEETADFGDGDITYTTPILLDAKSGERVTIDNDAMGEGDTDSESDAEADEVEAVADGGAAAAQPAETDDATESPAEPTNDESDDTEAASDDADETADDTPAGVPAALDELIDYFARTQGGADPDDLREFAESEVDDPDDVDWDAAAAECESRAN